MKFDLELMYWNGNLLWWRVLLEFVLILLWLRVMIILLFWFKFWELEISLFKNFNDLLLLLNNCLFVLVNILMDVNNLLGLDNWGRCIVLVNVV